MPCLPFFLLFKFPAPGHFLTSNSRPPGKGFRQCPEVVRGRDVEVSKWSLRNSQENKLYHSSLVSCRNSKSTTVIHRGTYQGPNNYSGTCSHHYVQHNNWPRGSNGHYYCVGGIVIVVPPDNECDSRWLNQGNVSVTRKEKNNLYTVVSYCLSWQSHTIEKTKITHTTQKTLATPRLPRDQENPHDPVKPYNPEDPCDVATPRLPRDPENSHDPVKPYDPEDPCDPETPTRPRKPTRPSKTLKPKSPLRPSKTLRPRRPLRRRDSHTTQKTHTTK